MSNLTLPIEVVQATYDLICHRSPLDIVARDELAGHGSSRPIA